MYVVNCGASKKPLTNASVKKGGQEEEKEKVLRSPSICLNAAEQNKTETGREIGHSECEKFILKQWE